jgi:predicted amino acid dehydrogenase
MKNKFAFIIHPIDLKDVYRKFPLLAKLPQELVHNMVKHIPPVNVSHIQGVESSLNKTEGYFVGCSLTTKQMTTLDTNYVIKKIINCGKMAEKLGAKIVGLGAHTSVVGDAGITVAKNLNIAVTSGNSYTIATAIEGSLKAAKIMRTDIKNAEIAVLGATGSIGKVCAMMLAKDSKNLHLISRDVEKLDAVAEKILKETGVSSNITNNPKTVLHKADIIVTVTSSVDTIIEPQDLKPGAVVCDVARPRDVSKRVAEERDDVLVIEGGVVEVPGDVNFNFNFGFPPKTSYACMAETMILALEERFENFTIGRDLSLEKVEEITRLAKKHGFKLAGFRSFERGITNQEIEAIALKAKANREKASA